MCLCDCWQPSCCITKLIIKLKSEIITESRYCFHFSLFHYCFKDFSHFFSSVIRKICLKQAYFILRMNRHMNKSSKSMRNIYTSPRGPSQTTHSHPQHPLTTGTRQNVTNSSCLYEFFFFFFQNHFKKLKNDPFNDNQMTNKDENQF